MKIRNLTIYVALFSISLNGYSQDMTAKISLIPEPVELQRSEGYFTLSENITVRSSGGAEISRIIEQFRQKLGKVSRLNLTSNQRDDATLQLLLNSSNNAILGTEGYTLQVNAKGIVIRANQPAGLFYGIQTLTQLLPKEVEGLSRNTNVKWHIPFVSITDYPRFGWRGLMFDVSRHFFTKEEVKRYIDNMVKYKYNLLHLHLTDDEGWRIEIKSMPKLTQIGAWRVNKVGQFGTFSKPLPNEPRDYGGFYTQEDIQEIIQYARERYVNVMPEIDVPGHSLATVVSYPELSCTPGVEKYNVRAGEAIMDWSRGAPPTALVDNTLCPANEKVYAFLDSVISEVAKLFPFEYIHMGGDEAPHNFWQKNPAVLALMQKEGLKTMEEVQGYFTKRVEAIVQSKGKKFIGWDEILDGKPSQSTAVMSWRGVEGGIKAAALGHEVVMSPSTYAYLDYMQGDVALEPKVYATLRLNKSYQFDPGEGISDISKIKGGQGNLWTEHIYNMRHAEYMLWPRALAVSESLWSPVARKNWNKFYPKVEDHFARFDEAEVKYSPAMYDPIILPSWNADNSLKVDLSTEIPGLNIHYTFDNSFPDRFYPIYSSPLTVPKDALTLKVITYRDNKPVGRMITFQIADLKARARRK